MTGDLFSKVGIGKLKHMMINSSGSYLIVSTNGPKMELIWQHSL